MEIRLAEVKSICTQSAHIKFEEMSSKDFTWVDQD